MLIPSTADYQHLLSLLSNDPGNAGIYAELMRMMNESKVSREPYIFEVDFLTIVAGATAPVQNFYVDSSSPFMLIEMNFAADLAGVAKLSGTLPVPNGTVLIQEQSSNRNWQNAAVPIPSTFGTGDRPFFLPQPRLIPANTTVNVTVASYEVAATFSVRLSFIGYRLYAN